MAAGVLARLPDLVVAEPASIAYRPSNVVSGIVSMPVRFTPTQACS